MAPCCKTEIRLNHIVKIISKKNFFKTKKKLILFIVSTSIQECMNCFFLNNKMNHTKTYRFYGTVTTKEIHKKTCKSTIERWCKNVM